MFQGEFDGFQDGPDGEDMSPYSVCCYGVLTTEEDLSHQKQVLQ